MIITKVDDKTGRTLLWCGGDNFDLMKTQKRLNRSGLVIEKIDENKWATLGPMSLEVNTDGR